MAIVIYNPEFYPEHGILGGSVEGGTAEFKACTIDGKCAICGATVSRVYISLSVGSICFVHVDTTHSDCIIEFGDKYKTHVIYRRKAVQNE